MSENTAIEWCDSTFNPWMGCTRVSPACDDCYAARSTPARTLGVAWGAGQERRRTSEANWRLPVQWERNHAAFEAEHGRRRRVFCASLADVFDNEVDSAWRSNLLRLILDTPHLDWLLLTKRVGNVSRMLADVAGDLQLVAHRSWTGELPANVWLGATVVNQAEADRDIPKLLAVPARVRFLSIEPMLGPVDLGFAEPCDHTRRSHEEIGCWKALSWVICGGESGPKARPMHPDWARSLRDQCEAAGVPFLFKQWGEWCPRGPESLGYPCVDGVPRLRMTDAGHNGQDLASDGGNDVWMNRSGKKTAGRLLDGVTHDGFPGATA